MKKIIVIAVLLFGLFAWSSALADHDTGRLPVTRGMLKAHAIKAAKTVEAYLYGQGLVFDSLSKTYIQAKADGMDELMRAIGNQSFSFSVNNPKKDEVYAVAYVRDARNRTIFVGWNQLQFVQTDEGWKVDGGAYFDFELVDPVPIEIEGLYSANVLIRDDAGKIVRVEYLSVEDGAVYLPWSILEQAGEIVLYRQIDKEQVVEIYNLANGRKVNSFKLTAWPWGKVKNSFRFADDERSLYLGPVARDVLLSLRVKEDRNKTSILVYDEKTGEWPVGVRVSSSEKEPRVWYSIPRPSDRLEIEIRFPTGNWDIVPDWELPPESERLNRLTNYYDGASKG